MVGPPLEEKKISTRKNELGEIFAEGAYWEPLQCSKVVVLEPENPTFHRPYAPTIKEGHRDHVPIKHNFTQTFERREFEGTFMEPQRYANGIIKKNKDGSPLMEEMPRKKGRVKTSFLKKHNLKSDSHPADFVNAFLSYRNLRQRFKHDPGVSIKTLTKWTNLKATLSRAGEGGTIYSDW